MATSGPNFPSTVTDIGGGSGGSPAGGSWTSPTNVTADDGNLATWNKPANTAVTGNKLELSGFGTFTGVGAGDTINNVQVEVETAVLNTTRMDSFQVELWNANTAIIGTTQTCTESTTLTIDTFPISGATFSQLANLRVRLWGRGAASNGQSSSGTVDYVSLTVDYTAGASDQTLSPSSISSGEVGGDSDVVQTIAPVGISSPTLAGNSQVGASVSANAIAGQGQLGTVITTQFLSLTGIASVGQAGDSSIPQTTAFAGISSTSQVGDTKANLGLGFTGIDSTQQLGLAVVTQTVAPVGVGSTQEFGFSFVGASQAINVYGIASGERSGISTSAAIGTALAANTFNTGTGNITVANSSVNGTAFTSVVGTPAGNTLTYDGSGQALVTLGATPGEAYSAWDSTVLGTATQRYGRIDATFSSVSPSGSIRIFRFLGAGSSRGAVQLLTTGRLQVINSAGSTVANGSVTVPTNQKIRIELRIVGDAAVGELELRWWSDSTSTGPPTEVLHGVNTNTGGTIDADRAGHSGTVQANFSYTYDNLSISNDGWTATVGTATVSPAGIISAEQLGAASVAPTTVISPNGIASSTQLGTTSIVQATGVAASSIQSAQSVGEPAVALAVAPSIEIGAVRWVALVGGQTLSPTGVRSSSSVGSPSVTQTLAIAPVGIASPSEYGLAATIATYTTSPTGISSAETAGATQTSQSITPTAIASTERSGSSAIVSGVATISPASVGSVEALGAISSAIAGAPQSLVVIGIESTGNVGIALLGQGVQASAIFSAERLGDSDAIQVVSAASVPTAQITGIITTTATNTIAPSPVGPSEAVSVVTTTLSVVATGISSAGSFGAQLVSPGGVSVAGTSISSSESFGNVPVAIAAAQSISVAGITSSQILGQAQVAQAIDVSGIRSQERLGGTSASPGVATLSIAGISSTQSLGDTQLVISYSIAVKSIAPTDNFGKTSLTIGIAAAAIASSESIGNSSIVPAVVTINAIGITTAPGFGLVIVEVLSEGARIALTAVYIGYHGATSYQKRYKGYVLEHEILAAAAEPLEV